MAVSGRGRCQLLAAVLLITIHQATNAPVNDDTNSHALQLAEPTGDGRGCYYNFEHYDEGDRILTNEPCLNCTCHNKMLMCYLRVCPFTKAIGQDCTVEKKPDQCCPIITCPQVPVALLTSSTTSETPPTTTALGRPDSYGCILEDNTFYPDGAQVPSDLKKPCELCYCIRNQTACVMQECTLNVEGCKPVYQEGVCCPVRYDCDYDEVATTPKPVGLITTPGGSSDCLHNAVTYRDGEMVSKNEKAPCEHCYCMRGDIVCAVQECGTPLEGRDCTPLERSPGQCCPNYQCANGTNESLQTSTEKEVVIEESGEVEKHESEESSSESDSSSEESQEVIESEPPKVSEGEESHPQETQSTEAPLEATVAPQQQESSPVESVKVEDASPNVSQPDDSHSEATQHEESETHVPQEPSKDPEVTNEIPALPSHETVVTTTEEPPLETARIPGEGSCLVEGRTYAHNTIVPTENPCQEICRCFSSIVRCNPRDCPPAPSPDENCMPVTTPGSCCPTYMCDQKTSDAPEVQDHKIDDTHQEGSSHIQEVHQSTLPPEELPATDAPALEGFPPESIVPGEHEQSQASAEIDSQQEGNSENSAEENGHLNSNIVHDASLHGGHAEMDSHENGNVPHSANDITTAPSIDVASEGEEGQEQSTQPSVHESVGQSEHEAHIEEQPQTESPILNYAEQNVQVDESESQVSESDEHMKEPEENNIQKVTLTPAHSTEQVTENASKPESVDDHSSPEETKNEESQSTDIPDVNRLTSINEEHLITESPNVSEHPHSDISGNENAQINDNKDMEHTLSSEEPQHIPEIPTTIPPVPDFSQDKEVEQSSSGEEQVSTVIPDHIQTENSEPLPESPEEHNELIQTQHVDDESVPPTTVTPEDNHEASSTQTSEEHKINTSADNPLVHENPLVSSSEQQSEEVQYPTTEKSSQEEIASETEASLHSESVENDSVPDSSQSVETAEHVHQTETHEKGSENEDEHSKDTEQSTAFSEESQANNLNEPIPTSPAPIDQDNTQIVVNSEEQEEEQSEPEKITESSEENKDILEEAKQPVIPEVGHHQESTSSNPVIIEEASPEKHDGTSDTPPHITQDMSHSQDAQPHEFSTIIYEEVKVTGMPSIESHVTEGTTTEHSISHQDSLHNVEISTQASHEIHIPGPEGIDIANISENEQSTVASQTEEKVNFENKSPEELANNEKAETEETTDGHHSVTSPEVINEINEEKESMNQITSDTAQLIEDINQIIHNEVNNQLFHGEQQTDESTSEESKNPSVEKEPEAVDNLQETSTTPSAEDSKPQVVGESVPEDVHNDVSQVTGTESPNEIEKEPAPSSPEETPMEPEIGTTSGPVITNPPSYESSSTSHHKEMSTEQPIHENDQGEHVKESEQVPPNEPTEVIHNEQNKENVHEENVPTTTEVQNAPIFSGDSGDQNKNDNKEVPKEQDEISEDKQKPETEQPITESPEGISHVVLTPELNGNSQDSEGNLPVVSEDQNAIPEDVTHIINTVSHVPDSANQVLEASGDDESLPSTEQPVLKPESEEPEQPEEVVHNGSLDESLHDSVPNKDNAIPEGNDEQITDSSHHEETPQQEIVSEETINHLPHGDSTEPEGTEKAPQEVPLIEETSADHNASGHNVETPSEVNEHTPTKQQGEESSEYHTEPTVESHDEIVSGNNEETPTEHQEATQEHHESTHEENVEETHTSEPPIEHTGPLEQEENRYEISSEIHTEAPIEHQPELEAVDHEESPIEHHEETSVEHHEETSVEHHEETSVEHHEETPVEHHEETPVEHHEEQPVEHHEEQPVEHHEESPVEQHEDSPSEHHEELPVEHHEESPAEHHEEQPVEHHKEQPVEQPVEHHEQPVAHHEEQPVKHQEEQPEEQPTEHHEEQPVEHHEEPSVEHHEEPSVEHHEEPSVEHHEEQSVEHHEEPPVEHHEEPSVEHHEEQPVEHQEETLVEHHVEQPADHQEELQHPEIQPEQSTDTSQTSTESSPDDSESSHTVLDQVHQVVDSEKQEAVQEHGETAQEPVSEHETSPEHQESESSSQGTNSPSEESDETEKLTSTQAPVVETSSELSHLEDHISTEGVEIHKPDELTDSHAEGAGEQVSTTDSNIPETAFSSSTEHETKPLETQGPDFSQNIIHSTETPSLSDILSSTQKPVEEQNPMFPTWSQKPIEHHTTPEPHPPEENPYPTGFESEYEDEEGVSYGPGTCRYGGKVYLSAQQIPRDDPCDFCFCFRSDIICLQQSCPPPIRGCYQETIKGFCCPRYECHVSMATMVNITTTTTTTTTTVPPLFFAHAYNGAATKAGCQVKGVAYHVGEKIPSTSGPCLECRCGANGQMKCDPTVCGPQEALLRQVMDAAVSRKRR